MSNGIKILAFSDLHTDTEAARRIVDASRSADILIGAGDFGRYGNNEHRVVEILQQADCPAILVAGNHDNPDHLRELCADWDNGHFLHGQSVGLKGVEFFGLGCEIPQCHDADWNQALSEQQAAELLSDCPQGAVLVTHAPPFGHADVQRDGSRGGSTALAAAIAAKRPPYNFCGHIHSSWGMSGRIGTTRIHNLGPRLNWFDL